MSWGRRSVLVNMACAGLTSALAACGDGTGTGSQSSNAGGQPDVSASPSPTSTPTQPVIPSPIVCWGDSLTEGAGGTPYPTQLQTLRPGQVVTEFGIGGQGSTQIAMRQGGTPTYLTLPGNEIVDGQNSIAALNSEAIYGSGTYLDPDYRLLSTAADNETRSINGKLAGVSGVLTRTASGSVGASAESYNFQWSDSSGKIVTIKTSEMLVLSAADATAITIIWVGRNNFSDPALVKQDISNMVSYLGSKKFIVLSVLNSLFPDEQKGGANWTIITSLNSDLSQLYPSNYIDIRSILVAEGAPGAMYPDAVNYPLDIPPAGLRSDYVHLNTAGYGIVSQKIDSFITKKGW